MKNNGLQPVTIFAKSSSQMFDRVLNFFMFFFALPQKIENVNIYQLTFTCSKFRCEICSTLTLKTLEDVIDVALLFLLSMLNIFQCYFKCYLGYLKYCKLTHFKLVLYPLKMYILFSIPPENIRKSLAVECFRGYRSETLTWNGIT